MQRDPLVIFPDMELWATGYLRAALVGRPESYASNVYVDNKTPNPRRDRMVSFRRDGGLRMNLAQATARLGVNVWAKNEKDATDLALLVEGLLAAATDGKPVQDVTTTGPSPVADESNQPRRFFTIEAVVRGTQLS